MWKSIVSAVALGWLLVTPVAGQNGTHGSHAPQAGTQFGRMMSATMDKMHEEMAASRQTGDPDRDFLSMMIPHHAGAVAIARLVLIYDREPLVNQLAEEIIAAHQPNINSMRA